MCMLLSSPRSIERVLQGSEWMPEGEEESNIMLGVRLLTFQIFRSVHHANAKIGKKGCQGQCECAHV